MSATVSYSCGRVLGLALFLLFWSWSPAQAQQDPWTGTWSSTFGELRLYSAGNYVVGDYGGEGLILGEKKFDLLVGVFTNPAQARSGFFTFQSQPGNRFRGSYSWTAGGALTDWDGTRTSAQVPALRNLASPSQQLVPTPNSRQVYDGTYDTPHGPLRLRMRDNFLFGDYDNKGVLVGQWNSNHFSGQFTNQGRVGWFKFFFNSGDGSFARGEWGWFPRASSAPWQLRKVSAAPPTLTNVVKGSGSGSGRLDASPNQVPGKEVSGSSPSSGSSQGSQQNSSGSASFLPSSTLSPVRGTFDQPLVSTALGMQEHVQWISQPNEADVLKSLQQHGYTLVGNGLITSEVDDPAIAQLTTERLRCYVAVKGNDVVVCFRGSKAANGLETALNGITDLNAALEKPMFFQPQSVGYSESQALRIHKGFHRAYLRLRGRIISALAQHAGQGKTLYVFGHSLGGAQATLCALDAGTALNRKFQSLNLVVSGSPRVGDVRFAQFFSNYVGNAVRIEVQNDRITMVPPMLGPQAIYRFTHVGRLLALDRQGKLIEPNAIRKNPLAADLGAHGNPVYYEAVKQLMQRSKASGFFNGRQSYLTEAGRAERN